MGEAIKTTSIVQGNSPSDKLHHASVQFFDWLDARSKYGRAFLAFMVGFLLSRGFAPLNIFPVLFIAIPGCLLIIIRARSGRQAFAGGWWFGLGLFATSLNWIGYSFTQQDNVPAVLAPFAVFALAGVLAVYLGLTFWVTWRLSVRGFSRLFLFSAAWVLMEIARGTWFTGFPWNLIGSVWAEWLLVAQSVYWTGIYGLSFLTVLAAGSVALLFEQKGFNRFNAGAVIACMLIFPVIAAIGHNRLQDNDTRYHLSVTMRLVQANIQQREKWISYLINDHFDNHIKLSRSSGGEGKAEGIKLLIWPETAVQRETFDRERSLLRWRMSRLLNFGSYAITGAPRFSGQGDDLKYYNSMVAFNSKGELYARYDKNHLVPFGEYLPFSGALKALGLHQLTGGEAFTSGDGLHTIKLPGVPPFSPLICYEAIFSGNVIRQDDRPDWMLNISNDAWFGMTNGPYQHLAQARLRAIEEGLPIVRSTSTGISAVIDAYGRTVSSMGLNRRGTIESPLPEAIQAAPFSTPVRVLIALFLSSGIVVFYLLQAIRRARRQ